MSVIEKAKAQYKTKLSMAPVAISIPEWDLDCYIKPAMNLQAVGELSELSANGKVAEAMAMTIIYRLIDAEGKSVFTKADKIDLIAHCDPDVISDVIVKINDASPSTDEIEKN